jgi:hypothetical protein
MKRWGRTLILTFSLREKEPLCGIGILPMSHWLEADATFRYASPDGRE